MKDNSFDDENFCESHCSWLDHHPNCTVPIGWLGVNKAGEIGKFRASHFGGSMPLFAHSEKVNVELLAAAKNAILALDLATAHTVNLDEVLADLRNAVRSVAI
jgi:hypothetical protein